MSEQEGTESGTYQRMRLIYGLVTALLLLTMLFPPFLSSGPQVARADTDLYGDFNGDGYDDLAIGVPGEDVGTAINAGSINVIYGSSSRLISFGNQIWSQNSPGILGSAETGDLFGDSIAGGDFNGDGYDDLAIGVPGEDVGTILDAGTVHVLYGTSSGLSAANDQSWSQDSAGVPGNAEEGDNLGSALAVGDFDNDGKDDLAIGVPGEDIGASVDAGGVTVLYGSASGLSSTGSEGWNQNSPGILNTAEGPSSFGTGDMFGFSLATGDFNNNGFVDLAIGVPGEDVGSAASSNDAGAVNVIFGSSAGLASAGNQFWHQDRPGIPGIPAFTDGFGRVLGAGDFNGDGKDDLAIGVPDDHEGEVADVGIVHVLYGSSPGLTATGNQVFNAGPGGAGGVGIPDGGDSFDEFGSALAAGDFDNDGKEDLAIGIPRDSAIEDTDETDNIYKNGAGAVIVVYGTSTGLSLTGSQRWHQDVPAMSGKSEGVDFAPFTCDGEGDCFGNALGTADFNGDGKDDLAIGVPGEDIGGAPGDTDLDQGAVNVIYGCEGTVGLCVAGNQLWHQNIADIADTAESDDIFGSQVYGGEHNSDAQDFNSFFS